MYALMDAWGTETTPEVVPLIFSEDLVRYMSQLKYIFQRNPGGMAQPPAAKRIRTGGRWE